MERTTAQSPPPVVFKDGLGDRYHAVTAEHEPLEVLALRKDLAAPSWFELALRERVKRLAGLQHEGVSRVRGVTALGRHASILAVVSDRIKGDRLADILAAAAERRVMPDLRASLEIARQVLAGLGQLHAAGVCHGLVGPERIIVTPEGRVVLVEHVLASAVEQLAWTPARYWRDLRILLPADPGAPQFDARADVLQTGATVVALVLGRQLRESESGPELAFTFDHLRVPSGNGTMAPLPEAVSAWLRRALQLDADRSFASAAEALRDLEGVLTDMRYAGGRAALCDLLAAARGAAPQAPIRDVPSGETVAVTGQAASAQSATGPAAGLQAATSPPLSPAPRLEGPAAELYAGGRTVADAPPDRTAMQEGSPVSATSAAPAGLDAAAPRNAAPAAVDQEPHREEPEVPAATATRNGAEVPSAVLLRPAGQPDAAAPQNTRAQLDAALHELQTRSQLRSFGEDVPEDSRAWRMARRLTAHAAVIVQRVREMPKPWLAGAALAVIAVTSGVTLLGRWSANAGEVAAEAGTLLVSTNPPGASVFLNGTPRGTTPLSVEIEAGQHELRLVSGGTIRTIPVTVTAGAEVSQFVEMPAAEEAGTLHVRSDPPGAEVSIDGQPFGRTPITAAQLLPGTYSVVVRGESGVVSESATITAGEVTTLGVRVPAAEALVTAGAAPQGWILVTAPETLLVYADGALIGMSGADRLAVPAGRRVLELVNESLGFRETRTVTIAAGQSARLRPNWPEGSVSINALPWAEVWVGGQALGETPIANVRLPIGTHEVIFRHPELGERRAAVTVRQDLPARLSTDLRRQ